MGRSLFFISFFSPSIFLSISARVSSLMVGPIDNNITSVSAFVLLWWKEQIFIYLLNVTHSWQSTFCSWPAMCPTKKCTTHNHPHTHILLVYYTRKIWIEKHRTERKTGTKMYSGKFNNNNTSYFVWIIFSIWLSCYRLLFCSFFLLSVRVRSFQLANKIYMSLDIIIGYPVHQSILRTTFFVVFFLFVVIFLLSVRWFRRG